MCLFKLQYENVWFLLPQKGQRWYQMREKYIKKGTVRRRSCSRQFTENYAGKVPSFLDFSIPFTHSVYSKKIIGIFIFGDLHLGLFPICRVRKSLVLIDVFVWALLRVCEQIVFSSKSSLGHQQSNIVSEDGVSICIQVW